MKFCLFLEITSKAKLAHNQLTGGFMHHDVYFHGAYWLLSIFPAWWATLLLFVAIRLVARPSSRLSIFSLSSLVAVVFIGSTVVNHGPIFVLPWLREGYVHTFVFLVLVVTGMFIYLLRRDVDNIVILFRDVFLQPALVALVIVLMPVIYFNGTRTQILLVAGFTMAWGWLLALNIKHNNEPVLRMNVFFTFDDDYDY